MKTNYLSAAVTALNPSLVTIAAWDSRSPAISQKETKRTKARGTVFAFLLAALLGTCVTTDLRAQVVVVPNAQATNDGNTLTTTPSGPVRFMQIHDTSQFGALAGPSLLTQFAWRPDQTLGQSGPKSVTLQIYASTTSRSVAGLSTTFADNLGTNNTLVFDGTLTWTTANLPGPGNTRQFDIVFPLTTPFLYDPAAGNLLLDFQLSADSGSSITLDRVSGNEFTRQAAAPGSPNATTAQFFVDSQVTQFTFESPPVVAIRASQVEVCWNSISNLTYQVQYRSDLTTNRWASLGSCVQGSGSMNCLNDSIVLGQPQRFYRVLLTNCVPD